MGTGAFVRHWVDKKKWYQAWSTNFPKDRRPLTPDEFNASKLRNQKWIDSKIEKGYTIYDIGVDPKRLKRSPFYQLEKEALKKKNYPTIDIRDWRP